MVKKDPSRDPTSLGSLLMEKGAVNSKQLDAALHFQQNNTDLLLGEALVHMGIISREVLEATLIQQELARNGASRQSNGQVRKVVRMAAQHTLATAGAGDTLVQVLQSLAAKMGSK
jgi:hypothetical protein